MITFRKASFSDQMLLNAWFNKPHVTQFWDNSLEMNNNFANYLNGVKKLYDYWMGFYDEKAFSLIITSDAQEMDPEATEENPFLPFIQFNEKGMTLDFMIGEEDFLGKGLASKTLQLFTAFQNQVDVFFIDPQISNAKAIHVYEKAGFISVGSYIPQKGYFSTLDHVIMKKDVKSHSFREINE